MRSGLALLLASAAAVRVDLLFASREVAQALSGGTAFALASPRHGGGDYYTSDKFLRCTTDGDAVNCTDGPRAYPCANDMLRDTPYLKRFVLMVYEHPLDAVGPRGEDIAQSVQIGVPGARSFTRWHSMTNHTFVEPGATRHTRSLSHYKQFDL